MTCPVLNVTRRFSTTQKAAYRWHVLNRAFAETKGTMEQGQVVSCLPLFYSFIHIFNSCQVYHVLIFAFLGE